MTTDTAQESNSKPACCLSECYMETVSTPSCAETLLFYLSLVCGITLSFLLSFRPEILNWKVALSLSIPIIFWGYMRSSRKDMTATGNLIAGALGGGGIAVLVNKFIELTK